VQSSVNLVTTEKVSHLYDDLNPLFVYFIERSTVDSLDECLHILEPFIEAQSDSFAINGQKHRTVCCVLLILFEHFAHLINQKSGDLTTEYLMRIVENSANVEATFWAMLAVECLRNSSEYELEVEGRKRFKKSIDQIASDEEFDEKQDRIQYM